jgi:hypothetical protein
MTQTSIEVFQELFLRCVAPHDKAEIRRLILAAVKAPWRHEVTRENQVRMGAINEEDVIAVLRLPFDDIDESGLVLWEEPQGYMVSNIVPRNVGELGIHKYNTILRDFVAKVAEPAAQGGAFTVEVTPPYQALEDWMDGKAARSLRLFSGAANKSTGASHPADEGRWQQFLIDAHEAAKHASPEQLARWLIEVERWPDDIARELASSYEFALGLLARYDREQP